VKLGWAFFALVAVAAAAYALNRGVYVGSGIHTYTYGGSIKYAKDCRYLFPSGIHSASVSGWGIGDSQQEAESSDWFCPLFEPN